MPYGHLRVYHRQHPPLTGDGSGKEDVLGGFAEAICGGTKSYLSGFSWKDVLERHHWVSTEEKRLC